MRKYAAGSHVSSVREHIEDMERLDLEIGSLDALLHVEFAEYGVSGLIFDYGGTIDTRGEHWSDVILRGYKAAGIEMPYETFWNAYVAAERELGRHPHVLPSDNFYDVLRKKVTIEIGAIELSTLSAEQCGLLVAESDKYVEKIASWCYDEARRCVADATPVLEALAARFPMVMVSNFYGNLNAVLDDFGIREYFRDVIESAVVGIRKPDPEIFRLGIEALGLPAGCIATIGDSYEKDILPASTLGTHTVRVTGKGDR
jgi:putative hydrolase of the HAD superfamily